jgi:hypothetical protein
VQTAQSHVGAALSAGAAGQGPELRIDALGRSYWHFDGSAYLDLAGGTFFGTRSMAVFAVCRVLSGNTPVFGIGNTTGYGAGPTMANTNGAALDTSTSGQIAPYVRGFSRGAERDAVAAAHVIGGQQIQVMGSVTRSSGAGGSRLYINTNVAAVPHPSINATGIEGGEIGRRPDAPGNNGKWAKMDLYELVVYNHALSDSEADDIAAALSTQWGMGAVNDQLVLEGDSIMAGSGVATGNTAARVLSTPGAGRVPASMRVTAAAASGNRVSNLLTRRDITNSWASKLLPGRNIVAIEIGRNDFTKISVAQLYADFTAYLNTPVTGLLQRGWEVRVLTNIASGSAFEPEINAYRALLRAPQFLTDVNAGPGQIFAGQVHLVDLALITEGTAGTIFDTTQDATNQTYYQGDATHPSEAGLIARVTGADTPEHGIAQNIL